MVCFVGKVCDFIFDVWVVLCVDVFDDVGEYG